MRLFTICGVILLAGPLLASSISYVTVDSSIFSGGVSNIYDSVTGLSQHVGSCYAQGSTNVVPCATVSSTPSTNTLGATAASVVISNGQSYDPQNGISGYAASSASANLATATVGVYASGLPCSPTTPLCSDDGAATAEIQDALTFINTTGSTQDIMLSWSFDGTVASNGGSDQYTIYSLFCFASGTGCEGNPNSLPHNPNSTSLFELQDSTGSVTNTQPSSGWVSTSILPGANGTSETFDGTFAIPNGQSTDSLNAYLLASCVMHTCDFSHTGVFDIGPLPDGVSFTSSSGVLLTGETPEPRSLWLLCLAAFAACAIIRGERRLRTGGRRGTVKTQP